VLTTDNKDRITGEPSGEPETLWGKINPKAFGDRVHRAKPAELEDKMKKAKAGPSYLSHIFLFFSPTQLL
jgi:pre-mRNA-splicing helicase BRR2